VYNAYFRQGRQRKQVKMTIVSTIKFDYNKILAEAGDPQSGRGQGKGWPLKFGRRALIFAGADLLFWIQKLKHTFQGNFDYIMLF
jgi:hypothetical protein